MLTFETSDPKKARFEILVVPVCENAVVHQNRVLNALAKKALQQSGFDGKRDQQITFYDPREIHARQVLVMGLGKRADLDAEAFRRMAGQAVKTAIQRKFESACFATPTPQKAGLPTADLLEAVFEGACLGNYRFDRYRQKKELKPLGEIGQLVAAGTAKRYKRLPGRVETVCEGTLLARRWVSTPSNEKRPVQFAGDIAERAEAAGLEVTVMDEDRLQAEGFGAMLAVGSGSRGRPQMVILRYKSPNARRTVALVGKGVTFDAGGLNLKPTGSMEDMKVDMSGAAAVAATLLTAARLKPKINVVGVMPLVENMPSGSAYRPGDVLHTYDGKTVEIGNTDAEGRLILIDAMAYTVKHYKPNFMIDMATLTGACVVALGEKIAGLFSPDDELAGAIEAAAAHTHERCWRMPLPEDYQELLKSDIADLNNISRGRWGGAITAALFLKEFVGRTRWAHIDIAGPASVKKEQPYCLPGGTGFGVRLLTEVIRNL